MDGPSLRKKDLCDFVKNTTGVELNPDVLTIGFARRFTSYKRADLIFSDLERLMKIGKKEKFQIVFAGKAHPKDLPGKDIIKRIIDFSKTIDNNIKIVF